MENPTAIQPGPEDLTSAIALANCGEIAADIVQGLAGKAVADSINDSPVTRTVLAQMAISRIIQNLTARSRNATLNGL